MQQHELNQILNELKRLTSTVDNASIRIGKAIYLAATGVSLVALSIFLVALTF